MSWERRTFGWEGLDAPLAVDVYTADPAAPIEVVWIHGEFGQLSPLPFTHFERNLVSLHQPGMGESGSADLFERLSDVATAYWWVLDQLDVSSTLTLAGHGLGATIALEVAIQQPQRVRSVVAAAPYGLWDDEIRGEDLFGLTPGDVRPFLYADLESPVVPQHFPKPKDTRDKGLEAIRRARTLGTATRYVFPLPDTGIAFRLYRLRSVPVTLMWGERDGIIPPGMAERWAELLPSSHAVVVPSTAHMLPYESPDFAEQVWKTTAGLSKSVAAVPAGE